MIFHFFSFLKELKIDFCVLNGYDKIIQKIDTDSDIDILFRQKDFLIIEKIIKDFSDKQNIKIVQIMHHDIWAKNFFLFNLEDNSFLNLDLYAELSRKSIIYFDEKEIFSSVGNYFDIPILSPEKEFINYFIKKLDKKDFSENIFNNLSKLYFKSEKLCNYNLSRFFPNKNKLVIEAFRKNSFKLIQQNEKIIINDFYQFSKSNLSREFANILRKIKRILYPTGITISFLGPDGSGKSTVINQLFETRLPFRRKDYFHLKPIKKDNTQSIVVSDPHAGDTYSKFKSYLKLIYFLYQYNFGWVKNVSRLKIKSSLVIFDRYFDDVLVDTKRYKYGGNLSMARLARFFIPKPEIYFILTADPKIIYKRKQEVEFDELKRQMSQYKKLCDNKRYFCINVDRTPDEICREITTIIMEKMNERY